MHVSKTQNGQGITEFVIVAPVLLILIFGALQFALIYHAKTTLNYAAFQAAREGAVSNARLTSMENALARGLSPLYTHCDRAEEVQRARDHVRAEIENGFGRIVVINPSPAAFNDTFAYLENGERVIPNDNLNYRVPITGSSGVNIQDANLLKIRASYCYPMYVPYINLLLNKLLTQTASTACPECTGAFTDSSSFERGCLDNNRFPIHSQAIMRMQSAAKENAINSSYFPGAATAGTTVPTTPSNCN
jgi:TadE-like protein